MSKDKPVTIALDIGSCHIRVLAARENPAGGIEILATGEIPSLGVQRGIITSVDDAGFAIKSALEESGLAAWAKQAVLYASVGGKQIVGKNSSGEVRLARADGLVSEGDVLRAIDWARTTGMSEGRQVVHAIPRHYRVGGYLCRRSPIGMHGSSVGAESHVITAETSSIRDLQKAVEMAGASLDGIVVGGLAAGQSVLTAEEKIAGAILVDIGGGTTEVVAYSQGVPFHTFVLPVGGNQIAGDLAIALNTPAHVAERLYLEEASATLDGIDPTAELTIRCFGPTGTRNLRRGFLHEVVRLRLEEILRMAFMPVMERAPEGFEGLVVLTGGVASLKGIRTMAEAVLETPVRVGHPVEDLAEPTELASPAYATAVGVARLAIGDGPVGAQGYKRQRGPRMLPQWLRQRKEPPGGIERGRTVTLVSAR